MRCSVVRLIEYKRDQISIPEQHKLFRDFFIMSEQFFNIISLNHTAIIFDGALLLALILLLITLLLIAILLLIESGGMRLC